MRADVACRLEDRVRAWGVTIDHQIETDTAVLAFGHRADQPVALKVIKHAEVEWQTGRVLEAFGASGVVRVLETVGGALLLERLEPATPLSMLCRRNQDDEATAILASVINSMSPCAAPPGTPFVRDWAMSFDRYTSAGHLAIPPELVAAARRAYLDLCASQRQLRLLHGDLHHDNVLYDSGRGWVAIDPKGVVGEIEFEAGASLRNPVGMPDLFMNPNTIGTRVSRLSRDLNLDAARVLAWAFVQAVLATIWLIEDGASVAPHHPWIGLAATLRRRLGEPL